MTLKISITLFALSVAIALTCNCGGGSTANIKNPITPTSSSPTVSIAFQSKPPSAILINKTASATAVVSNDPSNAGVDWRLTCANKTNCGSLSSPHTDSGKPVTYTPPSQLSGNTQSVNIVAFATADHNQNVAAQITVSAFLGILQGTYVFETKGTDLDSQTGVAGPYEFAGVVVLDGNGGVKGGEQTYSNSSRSVSDDIRGGSYFVGADGRGRLILNTNDPTIGLQCANPPCNLQGEEYFSLVVLSHSQASIVKIDDPNNTTLGVANETSVGTIDLQASTAAPTAGWAFAVSGSVPNTNQNALAAPTAIGGVLNIDSPNKISGAGSLADQDYPHFGKLKFLHCPVGEISGTVSSPDSFGKVVFNLTPCSAFPSKSLQLAGYIVDSSHMNLIETDVNPTAKTGFSTAGVAIGQGSATGTFTSNSSFSGQFVFGLVGEDWQPPAGGFASTPASLIAAAAIKADGAGAFSGYIDEFYADFFFQVSDSLSGSYSVDPSGAGRASVKVQYASNGPGPTYIFYLTGNGNPPLLLDADYSVNLIVPGPAGTAVGEVYPATSTASFSGSYAINLASNPLGPENDGAGEMVIDSTNSTFSGVMDVNLNPGPLIAQPLMGNFQSAPTSPFPGSLEIVSTMGVNFYLIDSSHGFIVENDSGAGTLAYFATRTPVCLGCP